MPEQPIHSSRLSWADYMRQNEVVRAWADNVRRRLQDSASRFSHGKSGAVIRGSGGLGTRKEAKLRQSLTRRVIYKHGISEGVIFRFERHGVFVHKGVGRGYKLQGGAVVRIAKTPPAGKTRQPQDWINVVIDQDFDKLANDIARINADASINGLKMKI
jgi:hypothetical protein